MGNGIAICRAHMSAMREWLAHDLAKKVERYGVVLWDDPEAAYSDVVEDVAPASATTARFDGSWLELRRGIENLLVGTKAPALVVYLPCTSPNPDPMEELRAVGTRYRLTLPALLKNSLAGQLTEQRIIDIGRQCTSLAEVEAALAGGESAIDARLISIIHDSSSTALATAVIAGTFESELVTRDLESVARRALEASLGGNFDELTGDALRQAAFRHLVLGELHRAAGDLPAEFNSMYSLPNAGQRRTAAAVLEALQAKPSLLGQYVALAQEADTQLHLPTLLQWKDGLAEVDATPAIEQLAMSEGRRRLKCGKHSDAIALADCRLANSWWTRAGVIGQARVAAEWRAIKALGELGLVVQQPVPGFVSFGEVMRWYTSSGWLVDYYFRQVEFIRATSGGTFEDLDDEFQQARASYEKWLDTLLHKTTDSLANFDVAAAELQRSIHEKHVRKADRCAFILVDALRYELGRDLANRLASVNADVTVEAAVATPPTITPVGMAALLPGAHISYAISILGSGDLEVAVGNQPIRTVKDRVTALENSHGIVADIPLDRVVQMTNKDLKKRIEGASLVLVRSTEIDSDGEADQLTASWASFDAILNVLQTAIAKLLHAGVERIVVTSDHGFLAVRQLGEHLRIDLPATGIGEKHRRAWVGRGGSSSGSTTKIALADFGVTSDLEIISPRGLGVFATGGGLQFFHGGLSPQEMVIPLLLINAREATAEPKYSIALAVAGDRISTGIVAVTVTMSGDLFTRESRVKMQLTQDGEQVGFVVGGDGVDRQTETVQAVVDSPRVVTIQIAANLRRGSVARLDVLDAATGVRLETIDIDVANDVMVDDSLE